MDTPFGRWGSRWAAMRSGGISEYTRRVRSARHIAIRVLSFALLGAATTVTVAWGFALWGIESGLPPNMRTGVRYILINEDDVYLFWPRKDEFGQSSAMTWRSSVSSLEEAQEMGNGNSVGDWVLSQPPLSTPPNDRLLPPFNKERLHLRHERRMGFPFRSLWCSTDTMHADWTDIASYPSSSGSHQYNQLIWLEDPKARRLARTANTATSSRIRALALPTGILPRGFAMNTAFYAGVWWVLLVGLARGRAWNRRRRGLCEKCTYDLRGLEPRTPCPECGKVS